MNKLILSESKIKNSPNILKYIGKYDILIITDSYSSKWLKKLKKNGL